MGARLTGGRPPHADPRLLALVVAGGAVGTLARALLEAALPAAGGFPVATFGINVAGAFLLGALLEALAHRGPDTGGRRALRLGLGTGVLGGFTTYSSLAVESATLSPATGAAYLAASVLLGVVAGLVGVLVARRLA